jgi:tetratricopeptide (TPR) repeat protein
MDIAKYTLHVAEAQGVNDWKTLSAQGTLHAKQGEHAQAQQYYLAALRAEPDAISVTNNLALSYALDGKADKAEDLLRKAVASGRDDKRVRQNLALVLGVQGKFSEARKMASLDMPEADAKASMAYLHNMLNSSTSVASLGPDDGGGRGADWQPYAENSPAKGAEPVRSADATAGAIPARTIETPLPTHSAEAAPQAYQTASAVPASTPQPSSGSTTVAKSPAPVVQVVKAEVVPETAAAPKGDKLAAPARTANLLKSDVE